MMKESMTLAKPKEKLDDQHSEVSTVENLNIFHCGFYVMCVCEGARQFSRLGCCLFAKFVL